MTRSVSGSQYVSHHTPRPICAPRLRSQSSGPACRSTRCANHGTADHLDEGVGQLVAPHEAGHSGCSTGREPADQQPLGQRRQAARRPRRPRRSTTAAGQRGDARARSRSTSACSAHEGRRRRAAPSTIIGTSRHSSTAARASTQPARRVEGAARVGRRPRRAAAAPAGWPSQDEPGLACSGAADSTATRRVLGHARGPGRDAGVAEEGALADLARRRSAASRRRSSYGAIRVSSARKAPSSTVSQRGQQQHGRRLHAAGRPARPSSRSQTGVNRLGVERERGCRARRPISARGPARRASRPGCAPGGSRASRPRPRTEPGPASDQHGEQGRWPRDGRHGHQQRRDHRQAESVPHGTHQVETPTSAGAGSEERDSGSAASRAARRPPAQRRERRRGAGQPVPATRSTPGRRAGSRPAAAGRDRPQAGEPGSTSASVPMRAPGSSVLRAPTRAPRADADRADAQRRRRPASSRRGRPRARPRTRRRCVAGR